MFLSVYVCVCNCVSRSSCMSSPQPGQTPASFSCPPCMDGYHTTVHQTFSFTYTSCHCSLSLSLLPFVITRWQKRCRLSASDWLLDIESGKGRGVPSLVDVHPLILLPGGPTVVLSAMVAVHPCQHLRCILSCPSLCR